MPLIAAGHVHVWRVPLAERHPGESDWAILSEVERARARAFHFERDRDGFVHAHSATRRILSSYTSLPPADLRFEAGPAGKPALAKDDYRPAIEFNISHSGDLALVAVATSPVGVDVECWNDQVEFLELADHYFSPRERSALRALANDAAALRQGFFQAWSRKEAYLKATGVGITLGLHHFDVTLLPGESAALIADRTDSFACDRWIMRHVEIDDGYSAAVVAAAPLLTVKLLHFT